MVDVRIHGRGGQGVVTTAEVLALACFIEGRHAQALPSFGSERTGAPVAAFVRVSDRPIRSHDPVEDPDVVVLQDATLLALPSVVAGLRPGGRLLVNTQRPLPGAVLAATAGRTVTTVPASAIATRCVGRDVPGPAMLGALAAVTDVVLVDSVIAAVRDRLAGRSTAGNVAAVTEAFETALAAVGGEARASAT
jgi:pyruvate ferredoxin oxidoreductase gamma subunit